MSVSGVGALIVHLPTLSECIELEPIIMGDQKYTLSGQLRRIMGFPAGITLEDNSFGAAHLKPSPLVAIEELKHFREIVVDTCIKASDRTKKLDHHLLMLNKYCEALTSEKQQQIEPLSQYLVLEPIIMGDQKYTLSGQLRRVMGFSAGITSEDNSFGAAHLKPSPPVTIEELKRFRAIVVDTSIKARDRTKKLDHHLLMLNKYCEAVTSEKQQQIDPLTNEQSGGLNLKMGAQIHQNHPPDLVTQKLEDRLQNVVLNKRVRTSVAETRERGMVLPCIVETSKTEHTKFSESIGSNGSTLKRKHDIFYESSHEINKVTYSLSHLKHVNGFFGLGEEQVPESSSRYSSPSVQPPRQATAGVAHALPHLKPMQDVSSVTIKATYGEDIIKFQLPFSSGIGELRENVTTRLKKLEVGTFRIKYQDDDGDWILITCNEALQDCLCSFRSMDKPTIRMLILPHEQE